MFLETRPNVYPEGRGKVLKTIQVVHLITSCCHCVIDMRVRLGGPFSNC